MFLTNWWKKISESSTQQAGTKKHAARADEWVFYRCALLAFLTIISSPLMAKDSLHNEIFHFNIPRQSADVSLITFAEQANLTLIVPFDEVSVITANRLVGRYPIKEALDILLSGTGLEATVGDSIRITFESNQDTGNKMKNRKSFLAVMFGVIFGAAQVTEAADTPTPGDPAESDTYAENETILEEVLVMGSNIRQSDTETAAPVTYIDRDSLELTSAGSVAEVVLNLAANAGTVLHPVLGANIGSSNFNLRNLGPGSTLVLVNGRRAGKSPLADNLGNQFFDLNQLPLSMIGRIDIQTDGASAIYGSEAVAGVVNITTRKGFEGVEVSYRHEDASNTANIVNFAFGSNSDKGSFALYATSYKASMSYRSDLDFVIERSGGSLLSTSGSPDEYRTLNPLTGALGRTKIIDPWCVEAGGTVSGGHCRYDFFDHTSPVPKDNRLTFFTEFDYDLGELFGFEDVTLFGELGYADNIATRAFGPQTNSNGPYDTHFLIPSSHPFNFIVNGDSGLQYIDPTTAEGAAFWQANPNAAANLTTSGSFRPIGPAIAGKNAKGSEIANTSHRYMVGIDSNRAGWNISTWYQNYDHENVNKDVGNSIASALQAGLTDGWFNPFGIAYADPGFISPKDGVTSAGHDLDRYYSEIAHTAISERTSSQSTFDFVISNSALFNLASGPVGFAFGYQKRQETYTYTPDKLTNAGLGNIASAGFPSVDAKTDVDSVFAEVAIPVTDKIDLQLALRYEDHGEQVGSTTDPKIAALWQVADQVLLRGSYGSSFQAPSAIQTGGIVGSAGVDFQMTNGQVTCNNPNGQQADYISRTAAKITGTLDPQSAKNINLGMVWEPTDQSKMSLDYWRYDYEGLIVNTQTAQNVLDNDCNDGILNDPNIIRGPDGVPRFIATTLENADSAKTDGIDANFSYGFSNNLGDFVFGLTVSYVLSFDAVLNGTKVEIAGRRNANTDSFGSMPELMGNISANWSKNNHQVGAIIRYKDSYLQDDAARGNTLFGKNIDSFTSLDLQYRYDSSELIGIGSWLTVGANNATDEDPPKYGAREWFDDQVHPIRGRVLYAEIGLRF